jgi:HD superfamily phosphodiesterase
MALSNETIVKNTTKYFKTAQENGFMTDELMSFLGEDFIKAPATTMKDLHNSFEGGLIDHLLKVTKYALYINEYHSIKLEKETILKVCLLHQIGKAKAYIPCTSAWHKENLGKNYEFADIISMKVGERSAYYALTHGIKFTEEEFQAIVNHDKESTDKQSVYHTNWLGEVLRMANIMAIAEEKRNNP